MTFGAQWDDIADAGSPAAPARWATSLDGIVESVKKVGQTTAVSLGAGTSRAGVQSLHPDR